MKNERRLVVILERGAVVGLQVAPDATAHGAAAPAATALLHPGPGQTRHDVKAVVPASFATPADRQRFHDELLVKIKARP